MTSKAYVFVDGLESKPVICGIVELDTSSASGRFRYGKSWLSRDDAFPLDPVNLPLSESEFSSSVNHGLFGALADAGADSWGEKVILSIHSTVPKNKLEFLLAGSGMGVGSLVFSLSKTGSKHKVNKNHLGKLPMLLRTKDAILADEEISTEAKKAFEYGVSMGGARPKTVVSDDRKLYLAKFNRPDDRINIVRVENASMKMLAELPVRVASTSVVNTGSGDVLLVERFDVKNGVPVCHFLSANSLFHTGKVSDSSLRNQYTYGQLAEFLRKHSANPYDAHELYYRMVFNILTGNTDDHTRNHAILYEFETRQWRLSPAYDVLPVNNSLLHGMGIGDQGRRGNIDNALSQSRRFGLKTFKARRIIEEVIELVSEWPAYMTENGVSDADIIRLRSMIPAQANLHPLG
ncbi:MAG: type II toxin-antitoxin system HipA family toxin [Pseudomonadota bacterium]|nr:type II toxin-antitoxin system HipA family toxin [Pseudomonadota bacterium]